VKLFHGRKKADPEKGEKYPKKKSSPPNRTSLVEGGLKPLRMESGVDPGKGKKREAL